MRGPPSSPPSGGKRKTRSPVGGNDDNNATVHDDEPCYGALVDAFEQGGDPHSSSALSSPSPPCMALTSGPPRMPPCPCVMRPCPYASSPCLPHNAVCTRIVVESAAVVMPQPSLQDHRRVLHQDHRLVPTVLAPNGYPHGQGQHRAVPLLVYQIDQRLDYLVGYVIRESSHWTASITVLLCLCRRRPPPHHCRRPRHRHSGRCSRAGGHCSHALWAGSGGTA